MYQVGHCLSSYQDARSTQHKNTHFIRVFSDISFFETLAVYEIKCKNNVQPQAHCILQGADKSLARPDWKKQLKGRHFSSDAEVIPAGETWLDGQLSALFLSGL